MTIEPKDATHIRLTANVYGKLQKDSIHKVDAFDRGMWRVKNPESPDNRMADWWIAQESAVPCPAPDAPTVVPVTPGIAAKRRRILEGDGAHRKQYPMATGLLDYFPDALAEVARISKVGNDRHNPGQPLHHARGKSMDHADCIMRHLAGRGGFDGDTRESASLAWRALALLQEELEAEMGLPLPRGAWPAEPTDAAAVAHVEGVPLPEEHPVEPLPAFLPSRALSDGDTLQHQRTKWTGPGGSHASGVTEDAFDPWVNRSVDVPRPYEDVVFPRDAIDAG